MTAIPNHPTTSARPTVVLLHSSAASARQWDGLAGALRSDFEVHAIDLHGHGARPAWHDERPMTLDDEAQLVLPILERAGQAHLIGHSYGGAIALHLAMKRPGLVGSVAVYEPVLFGLMKVDAAGVAAREAFDLAARMRLLVAAGDSTAAAGAFVDYWAGGSAWSRMAPQQQRSVVSRMATVVQHFDALYGEPPPVEQLARLPMPVLCLTGTRSTAAARRIGELLRELLPGQQHEAIDGLTHMGPITHPAVVNERLLRFLGVRMPCRELAEAAG
jgi:pimeloyl-ACP methyl ester carboxylesterase